MAKSKDKKNDSIDISGAEKEVLREMVQSERANLNIFGLSNREEQSKYERVLKRLDGKLI